MKESRVNIPLFEKISAKTKERLLSAALVKEYSRGQTLIRSKEVSQDIFIQLSGKSMIYNLTYSGKRKILFVFGKGILLNDHIFDEHGAASSCEIIEPGMVLVIPKTVFEECMRQDYELTRAVIQMQEWKNWRLEHQLKNTVGAIYLERKLAAKLWKLSRDFGKQTGEGIEIEINMTMEFLADMLGAPRENTSRICTKFTEMGLIKISRKRITILDPVRLSHFYKTGELTKGDMPS